MLIAPIKATNWDDYGMKRFEQIDIDKSLTHQEILAIYEDKENTMWFATYMALFRYDGNRIERIVDNEKKHFTNHITHFFYEDKNDNFWLGTNSGLVLYDKEADRYETFNPEGESIEIRSIVEDAKGFFWIGTYGKGLYRFYPKSKQFAPYNILDNSGNIQKFRINALLKDNNANLWIGTEQHGLIRLNTNTNKYIQYYQNPEWPNAVKTIMDLAETPDGDILVATWHRGLEVYDYKTNTFTRYLKEFGYKNEYSFPITKLERIPNKTQYFIATKDAGLFTYDYQNNEIVPFKMYDYKGDILSIKNLWRIYYKNNVLWLGFRENGVYKYSDLENQIPFFSLKDVTQYNDFVKNSESEIFLATNNGLILYNVENHSQRLLIEEPVRSFQLKNEVLWVCTDLSIYRFDIKTEKIHKVVDLNQKGILDFWCDRKDNLWISIYGEGVYLLESTKTLSDRTYLIVELTHYSYNKKDVNTIASNIVWTIFENADGDLLFGTNSGLSKKMDEIGGFQTIFNPEIVIIKQEKTQDPSRIWMSNFGTKIYCFDYKVNKVVDSLQIISYERESVASFEVCKEKILYSIEDKIHCYNTLSKIDVEFEPNYGLDNFNYILSSSTLIDDESIAFGGNHCFNIFKLEDIKKLSMLISSSLSDVNFYNIDSDEPESRKIKKYTTDDGTNFFKIRYSSKNYSFRKSMVYYHKMEGMDEDWIEDSNSEKDYLLPGKYSFRVKTTYAENEEDAPIINVEVKPLFYQSVFFYVLIFVFVILFAYVVYRIRLALDNYEDDFRIKELKKELSSKNIIMIRIFLEDIEKRQKLQSVKTLLASSLSKVTPSLSQTYKKEILSINEVEHDIDKIWIKIMDLFNVEYPTFFDNLSKYKDLSSRDLKILMLMKIGTSDEEIATYFDIQEKTLLVDKNKILAKMSLSSIEELKILLSEL